MVGHNTRRSGGISMVMDVQVVILVVVVVVALAIDDAVVVVGVGDTFVVVVVIVLGEEVEEVGVDGFRGNNGAVGIQRVVDEAHRQRGEDSSTRTSIKDKWGGGSSCGLERRGSGGPAHFQD